MIFISYKRANFHILVLIMSFPSVIRIIKWLCLGLFYLGLIITSHGIVLIYLIPAFILAYRAYKIDLRREIKETDTFKNENLFFRYGYRIEKNYINIPIKDSWSNEEILEFVTRMSETMIKKLREQLSQFKVDLVIISDKALKSDKKRFGKIFFTTTRGTKLSHFFHYAICGKSVVSYYFTYIRGIYKWHDIFNFVFSAPVFWEFWLISWLNNEFSIISFISKNINNSFDTIDLNTLKASSRYIMLNELRIFLKDEGLLTEEVAQLISQTINNSQNISVNNSSGVSLKGVSNLIQGLTTQI